MDYRHHIQEGNQLNSRITSSYEPTIVKLETHIYNVRFNHNSILTTLTSSSRSVISWIRAAEAYHRRQNLVVSIDFSRRPKISQSDEEEEEEFNPNQQVVSVLQLCIGHVCLVFEFIYTEDIPKELFEFLANRNYTFVSVGIDHVICDLRRYYGFHVHNAVDLRRLASTRTSQRKYMDSDLAGLAKAMLRIDYWKPNEINETRQNKWRQPILLQSKKVLMYAAIEGFLSFEIGIYLRSYYDFHFS